MVRFVAVIGDGDPDPSVEALAEDVGALVARAGCGLVTGGLGGVMAAASRGASREPTRGPVVAIIPGTDKATANPHADVVIPSGLGYARNLLVVLTGDAVIAVGGRAGTLSEIAHAWQMGKPICALTGAGGWGQRLAGQAVDDRRAEPIVEARSIAEVEDWLHRTLPTAALPRPD